MNGFKKKINEIEVVWIKNLRKKFIKISDWSYKYNKLKYDKNEKLLSL